MNDNLRSRVCFSKGWRFMLEDRPEFSDAALDDSGWRSLSLPHDWGVEHPVDEANPTGLGGGYAVAGAGWYRKRFRFDEGWNGMRVALLFGGGQPHDARPAPRVGRAVRAGGTESRRI